MAAMKNEKIATLSALFALVGGSATPAPLKAAADAVCLDVASAPYGAAVALTAVDLAAGIDGSTTLDQLAAMVQAKLPATPPAP